MKKDFDNIIESNFRNITTIEYGIINGNNTIVLIKGGQDSSIYGYENKYLKIAKNINEKYGYTVICSSNPFDGNNPLDDAFTIIENYCKKKDFKDYEVYYMGHSKGGIIGAQFGIKYPQIKRMLLINIPLMINYHKTKEGLNNFSGEQLVLIFVELDPSYKYIGLLNGVLNNKIKYFIIKGEDHNFSKNSFNFKELPKNFLLKIVK